MTGQASSRRKHLGRTGVLASVALVATALVSAPALAATGHASASGASSGHKILYPTVGAVQSSRHRAMSAGTVNGSGQLSFGGDVAGVGVTTGAPKVYLVFWGTQWGTETLGNDGYQHFSNDAAGMAPRVQALMTGIGTGGETWSGVMTQYCDGVAAGTITCPTSSAHVGYPTGGALAGVWYDNSAAEPTTATDNQLGTEALAAAHHFGNTTASSNRNVQYVVISSSGLHPGGYNTPTANWCAWHDWNGDTTLNGGAVTSDVGNFAFTNLPYIPNLGASCGANYVNAGTAGALDGVTIVEGHEYAETITDQFPAGGWTDLSGYENGDKCAWVGTGGTGGAQNVTFGTTGSFAMQGTYSNDSTSCLISHAIVGASSNTVTVASIAAQSGVQGSAVTPVTATATDSAGPMTYTWSATGLPSGISIGSSTGTMSGTPTVQGAFSVTVKATDTSGASGTTSFTWTVTGNTVTVSPISNQSGSIGVAATTVTPSASDSNTSITTFAWSATGLPGGISIDPGTGTMSGTPTSSGTFTVRVTATDSTGAAGSTSFTWTVAGYTVTVTNPGPQSSLRGQTVSLQMTGSDSGGLALTWSASGLPKGLTINSTTGLISGTVNKRAPRGTYSVTVTAKDSSGSTGTASFTWTIN